MVVYGFRFSDKGNLASEIGFRTASDAQRCLDNYIRIFTRNEGDFSSGIIFRKDGCEVENVREYVYSVRNK